MKTTLNKFFRSRHSLLAVLLALFGCVPETYLAPRNSRPGDTIKIKGEVYTVVNTTMLYDMVAKDMDVTKVITTLVNDMSGLFEGKEEFILVDVNKIPESRGERRYLFKK